MKSRKLKTGIAVLAASFLLPVWGSGLSAEAGASASTIDPGREVSLTVVCVRGAMDASGEGMYGAKTSGAGIRGSIFSALKVADLKLLGNESGYGMYYVPTASGEELIRMSREAGVEEKPALIGDVTAYSGAQMEDLIDRFCRDEAGGKEGDDGLKGEARLTDFVRKQRQSVQFQPTDTDGKSAKDGLSQGLYLVAKTGDQEETGGSGAEAGGDSAVVGTAHPAEVSLSGIRPFLVSLPMTGDDSGDGRPEGDGWRYDVTVYPKQQSISIPKYIVSCEDGNTLLTREDVEIGEVFEQIMVPAIPATESWHSYEKYVVTDEMDEGMVLKKIKAVRFGRKVEAVGKLSDFQSFTDLAEDVDFAVSDLSGEKNPERKNGFSVTLLPEGLKKVNASGTDCQLEILYETVLDGKASDGSGAVLENRPSLDWKVSGEQGKHLDGNRPGVCSYRLKVTKTGLTDPTKVSFSIRRKQDGSICRFQKESEGSWLMLGADTPESEGERTVSPASDGTMTIRGLDDDNYQMTECSTESGYELLSDPLEVKFQAEEPADGCLSGASVSLGEGEEIPVTVEKGTASFAIRNRRSVFPKLGGTGRTTFYLSAAGGVLLSVLLLGKRRKRYGS